MSGYTRNIPQGNQTIASTTSTIASNFNTADTAFGIDHVAFVTPTNQGLHNKVTLIKQSGDPAAVAAGPIEYSKLANSVNELFMRRATGDGSGIIQLTRGNPYNTSNANQQEISTFLAGPPGAAGFILKSGIANKTAVGGNWTSGAINFLTAFPSTCVSVVITPQRGNNSIHVMYINNGTISASGCGIRSDDNSWNFVTYVAMGY